MVPLLVGIMHGFDVDLSQGSRPLSPRSEDELCDRINIQAVSLGGEDVLALKVRAGRRLREIVSRLSDLLEVPECYLRLVVGSKEVEAEEFDKTITEVGFGDGCVLQVVKVFPSPLSLYALAEDDADVARYMLRCGADPNEVCPDHQSVLLWAGELNFPAVCQVLVELEEFARINAVDENGHTALHWAAFWKQEDVCLRILEREDFTAVNEVDLCGRVALHYACAFGLASVSWAILERQDFDTIAVIDGDGLSVLHSALVSGMPDVAFAILTHPQLTAETLNSQDHDQQTVLMLAIQLKFEHICSAVLQRADFTATSVADKYGATALHHAAERNLPNVCKAILGRAGNELLVVRDTRGKTAHDVACEGGLNEVVAVLDTRGRGQASMSHHLSLFG